jgi:hypothetical protein
VASLLRSVKLFWLNKSWLAFLIATKDKSDSEYDSDSDAEYDLYNESIIDNMKRRFFNLFNSSNYKEGLENRFAGHNFSNDQLTNLINLINQMAVNHNITIDNPDYLENIKKWVDTNNSEVKGQLLITEDNLKNIFLLDLVKNGIARYYVKEKSALETKIGYFLTDQELFDFNNRFDNSLEEPNIQKRIKEEYVMKKTRSGSKLHRNHNKRFEGFEAERFSFSFSLHKIGRWQKERSLKLEMISSTVMANWQ